jgi:Lysylphosphatidylglycerol synthase TM region
MINKVNKILLNYVIGAFLSIALLFFIYKQLTIQLATIRFATLWHDSNAVYFLLALLLLPINATLEATKWHLLVNSVQKLSFGKSLCSYLAGLAVSVITPNRIGEYPGRLLYLRQKHTLRLISVAVLGITAQLVTLFAFGIVGLVYYNLAFPGGLPAIGLAVATFLMVGTFLIFWKFDKWLPASLRFGQLRKVRICAQLLKRFSSGEKITILLISAVRYGVFTAQYLFLLYWMNVSIPAGSGFCMSALFFWCLAMVPSFAIAELAERGSISLYLFQHFSSNTVGILAATMVLWLINLMIPAIVGSILMVKLKIFR